MLIPSAYPVRDQLPTAGKIGFPEISLENLIEFLGWKLELLPPATSANSITAC